MTTTPSLLSASEAAERRGVDRRTITRWAKTGRLPVALRLTGRTGALLFTAHDVDRAPIDPPAPASTEGDETDA